MKHNDYLKCNAYQPKGVVADENGFIKFFDKKTEKHYFSKLDSAGEVLLISEGYPEKKSMDNGIKSVLKNFELPQRWKLENLGKEWVIILKAGNNQEIARTCSFKTKAEAENLLTILSGSTEESEVSKKTAAKKSSTPANSIEKVSSAALDNSNDNDDLDDEEGISDEEFLNAFLPDNAYTGRNQLYDDYGITGFVKFHHPNNLFYYGIYNPDGTLYLKSPGFDTELDRDEAFDYMESVITLEENYRVELFADQYYAVLTDYEEGVLAISQAFEKFIDAYSITPGGRPQEITDGIF